MIYYILVGEEAVKALERGNFKKLEEALNNNDGDYFEWNSETDSFSDLLNMLQGWDSFKELSMKDIIEIDLYTEIGITSLKEIETKCEKLIELLSKYSYGDIPLYLIEGYEECDQDIKLSNLKRIGDFKLKVV